MTYISPTECAPHTLTSEEWLREAVMRLHDEVFAEHLGGAELPAFRISRGWPRGSRKAIGQCWSTVSSKDGATEMFISPVLGTAERVSLLQVVAHEMVHMYVGAEHGHKAPFAKLARAIGLEGKLTATTAGAAFVDSTAALLADMPAYPAEKMSADSGTPVKKTYLLRVTCPECPEVVLRMTMKVVAACQEGPHGAVLCPCCGEEAEVELPG